MLKQQLLGSTAPHIRTKQSTQEIMWSVSLSLTPVLAFSIYHFGLSALYITFISILSCVAVEAICLKLRGKPISAVYDGSAVLTGILLAFNLPPTVPFWLPIIGAMVAIGIAKQAFGGLGYNIFNPAIAGRCFLLTAWPVEMTSWQVHGVTSATPLAIFKEQGMHQLISQFNSVPELYWNLITGTIGGCIGETSAVLLTIGAIYLLYKKIISWHIPVTYIASLFVLGYFFAGKDSFCSGDPFFYIFSGGVFLGAFYMATDMVTSPLTKKGKILFGFGCGLFTFLIRKFGTYPEGVSYSILLMNTATPIIDRYLVPKKFGINKGAAKPNEA